MQIGNNKEYDKLSPHRKKFVDEVIKNLEQGVGLWRQGWIVTDTPVSGATKARYRGVNNIILWMVTMLRGYKDNRWFTFHQIEKNNWKFKTDNKGKSMGKNAGIPVDFFEVRDKQTKKAYNPIVLEGMTSEEKVKYIRENVYPSRRTYCVFNADIIDGVPAIAKPDIDLNATNDDVEMIIDYWGEYQSRIEYGGDIACYYPIEDKIKVPNRDKFESMQEFYGTILHEIAHSTGHKSRLNRNNDMVCSASDYAMEELRAEMAAMFLEQETGVRAEANDIKNHSAYIKTWAERIRDNPNALFAAIADAENIVQYVIKTTEI